MASSSTGQTSTAVSTGDWLRRPEKNGERFLNPVPTTVGGLRMLPKILPLFLTNREQRTPQRVPGPFRTDPSTFTMEPASGLRVTWFGHSSSLVEIDGVRLLIDPVWDERASPSRYFGPRRFFPPTLPVADLPVPDAILLSHDHYDHLGKQTVRLLARRPDLADTLWITSQNVGALLRAWGVPPGQIRELAWTDITEVPSLRSPATLRIHCLPARHFSGRSLWNRFQTLWSAFVLAGPTHRVYFGADTGWWPGFGEIGQNFGPFDLTLLEIGAFNELWRDIHLGPDGAARAFTDLGGTGLLMPIHWGLFDLALHDWRQPISRLLELATQQGITLWSPEPGQPTEPAGTEGLVSRWWQQP